MSAATSERILQCQLKLAHRDGRGADHPEALTRGIGRRSRKYRTGENVPIGRTPRRVVQRVERFHPELYDVVFVIRHLELLMHREFDRLEVWCGQCVPPDIAEGSGGGFDERSGVVPSGRS